MLINKYYGRGMNSIEESSTKSSRNPFKSPDPPTDLKILKVSLDVIWA